MIHKLNEFEDRIIRVANIKWQCFTAGPHDGDGRTEVFLQGCPRADAGNPCYKCFNPSTWKMDGLAREFNPLELSRLLCREMPNSLLTIGGGEPFAQSRSLSLMLFYLRQIMIDLHVIVYTGYKLEDLVNNGIKNYTTSNDVKLLLRLVDEVVDGEFNHKKNIWNPKNGYIGSSNQRIFKFKKIAKMI